MGAYGTVSSAEDVPLLKKNKRAPPASHSSFKRIAAATLLAGGAFAVASKRSAFTIDRNQVSRLGDALEDAKAGAFYPFFLLLPSSPRAGIKNWAAW